MPSIPTTARTFQRPPTAWSSAFLAATLCAGPGCAQARSSDDAPSRSEIDEILAQQSVAFEGKDLRAFLEPYMPLHRGALVRTLRPLRRVIATADVPVTLAHALLHLEPRGDRSIAFVRSTFLAEGRGTVEQHYAMILGRAEGAVRILTQVEYDRDMLGESYGAAVFQCRACNYKMAAAADDWVMIPRPARIYGGLECIGYFSLHRDLTVHIVVRADGNADESARDLLRQVVGEAGGTDLEPRIAEVDAIEPWLPMPPGAAPEGMTGARTRVVYAGGERMSWFHVLAYGDVHYFIDVEGERQTLERADDARAMVESFEVLDPDVTAAQLSRMARAALRKGVLEGSVFEHAPTGIRYTAPAGWTGVHVGSSHLFQVRFRAPRGRARVALHAVRYASRTAAETLVDVAFADQGTVREDVRDSGWQPATANVPGLGGADELTGFEVRTYRGTCAHGAFCMRWILDHERGVSFLLESRGADAEELQLAERALKGLSLGRD